jgi:hypothetical protein
MAKKASKPTPVDTSGGSKAYELAVAHKPQVEPRLPAGTIDTLAEDLATLGAAPAPTPVGSPSPAAPAAPSPPSLSAATATASNLVTAIHEAVAGAKPKPAVRKAYGVSRTGPVKEPKAVVAAAQKILTQAKASPSEALALGIMPADVTALEAALDGLTAAEAAAHTAGGKATTTAKQKHAAAVRMHEATARIAGAGVLAFAQDAAVRAQFAGLVPKRKK